MIRFLLDATWLILFLILSIPVIIVEFFIGLAFPKARAVSSQWIVGKAFKFVIFLAGTKVIIKGRENIPADVPVLFVPNHRSIFDVIITYPYSPKQTGYVAKLETKKFPVFSIWMAFMNCQFLDRKDIRQGLKVINKCADLVKNGTSICIFPEGTRNKSEEDMLPFHDGSFKIAEKANCPVVPIVLNNTDQIFEAHFPKIKKTTITLEYCKPIDVSALPREEKRKVSEMCRNEMLEVYNRNKEYLKEL